MKLIDRIMKKYLPEQLDSEMEELDLEKVEQSTVTKDHEMQSESGSASSGTKTKCKGGGKKGRIALKTESAVVVDKLDAESNYEVPLEKR